tara:strand:+ start:1512 stop:1631 length:120 start_codon:yes stop_codon:yes gene_type:complete
MGSQDDEIIATYYFVFLNFAGHFKLEKYRGKFWGDFRFE